MKSLQKAPSLHRPTGILYFQLCNTGEKIDIPVISLDNHPPQDSRGPFEEGTSDNVTISPPATSEMKEARDVSSHSSGRSLCQICKGVL